MEITASSHKGWWVEAQSRKWSLSWSVAHSLRWYLLSKKLAVEVFSVEALAYGDLVFYDFQGNGAIDHCAIVYANEWGNVTVNAHTSDSFNRNYQYTDSTAYTPNIQYYFLAVNG